MSKFKFSFSKDNGFIFTNQKSKFVNNFDGEVFVFQINHNKFPFVSYKKYKWGMDYTAGNLGFVSKAIHYNIEVWYFDQKLVPLIKTKDNHPYMADYSKLIGEEEIILEYKHNNK